MIYVDDQQQPTGGRSALINDLMKAVMPVAWALTVSSREGREEEQPAIEDGKTIDVEARVKDE